MIIFPIAVAPPERTIAGIVTKLETRLTARLVDQIRPILAGRSAEVQRAILLQLVAEFIADKVRDP